jgi:very-short-patch-repair endonuclease
VSVPRRRTKVFEAVVVHQLTDLTDDHITTVHGLPITTPERTIIDLSAVLGRSHLEQIIDNSLAARRVDLEQLGTLFGQLGRRGKPGTAKLRAILEPRQSGYHAPESELERRLVGLLETHGLPNPVLQFSPEWLAPTNGRVDLAYPEAFLVIEGDSRRWHTMLNSFESDRQRDNAAQLAGWSVLRFTWDDIVHRPEHIAETVRKALNLSRSRSYMSGSS